MTYKLRDLVHLDYETVKYMFNQGRISERLWATYQSVWVWSAAHFGGYGDYIQTQYWNERGKDAFWKRIDRTHARVIRLTGEVPQWNHDNEIGK